MNCELCPNPIWIGGTTCRDHAPHATGTGTMLCQLCHQPQKRHTLGYPEHATWIHITKGKRHTP